MKFEYCKYSNCIKEGLSEYLKCSKLSDYCKYQRYCTTKKRVVHTDDVKKYKDLPLIGWTVKSQEQYRNISKYVDNIIFEDFEPKI